MYENECIIIIIMISTKYSNIHKSNVFLFFIYLCNF